MISAGMSRVDRLRVEVMRELKKLPSPSLEFILGVAKSFTIEIDDVDCADTGGQRPEGTGVGLEPRRVVLRQGVNGLELEARIRFLLFWQENLGFERDYRRDSAGRWWTDEGQELRGLMPADFEVIAFCDVLDRLETATRKEQPDG